MNARVVARVVVWSLALRVLKHVLPLPRLVRLVQAPSRRRPVAHPRRREPASLTRLISALAPPPGHCLERSLLLYRLLAESHAKVELVIGFRTTARGGAGHAWVLVDGQPHGEAAPTSEGFVPLLVFRADDDARA